MVTITPLQKTVSETEAEQLNVLLQQLRSDPTSHTPVDVVAIEKVTGASNTVVLVAKDGEKIIGTGTIIWNQILTDRFAFIEDVVVDERYRGQGLGGKLVQELIEVARANAVATIGLTSRPTRLAANHLYPKLGFKKKETNYYELDL